MGRQLFLWTDAGPKTYDRAKYTYRGMSLTGILSPVASGELPEANQAAALLEALLAGLQEYSGKQKQTLCIVCGCPYIITSINQKAMEKWESNGYKTSKNEAVKHSALWHAVYELSREKQIDLTARAPSGSETEIMYEMGASYFLPHSDLTGTA